MSVGTHVIRSINTLLALHSSPAMEGVLELAQRVRSVLRAGGTVYIAGNGGSAADAQHFAAELVGRFKTERRALAAVALTTDSSVLTAIANDYGFEHVFSRQLDALLRPADMFIGISTSGISTNVLCALAMCESKRALGALLTSERAPLYTDAPDGYIQTIRVPGTETALIQQAHGVILHAICAAVDEEFGVG